MIYLDFLSAQDTLIHSTNLKAFYRILSIFCASYPSHIAARVLALAMEVTALVAGDKALAALSRTGMVIRTVLRTGVDVGVAARFWVEGAPHCRASGAFLLELEMLMGNLAEFSSFVSGTTGLPHSEGP